MCIFCKIVQGEIPCYKVYEDANVLAFLDISQVTKGHTLVVPKKHYNTIFSLDQEIAAQLFTVTQIIANKVKDAFKIENINILNNSGKLAGQEVDHFHLHILPIYQKGDFTISFNKHSFSPEEMKNIAFSIKNSGS